MSGNSKAEATPVVEDQVTSEAPTVEAAPPPTKDSIRSAVFGAKPESRVIDFFGNKIELRQPNLGVTMAMRKVEQDEAMVQMLVRYAFVPVFDGAGVVIPGAGQEHIFEETDADSIKGIPFGPDMMRLSNTVNELVGITSGELDTQVANAAKSPGDGRS